jgi:competence protein ComEC
MPWQPIYIWKQAPFLRLILPLIAGILFEAYFDISFRPALVLLTLAVVVLIAFNFSLSFIQFKYGWLNGLCIQLIFFSIGILLLIKNNCTLDDNWVIKHYQPNQYMLVRVEEPLTAKAKTFKTTASIISIGRSGNFRKVKGNILLYIMKDSLADKIEYGSLLVVTKRVERITNSGIPGAFDFSQYEAFQQTWQQVFLRKADYIVLPQQQRNWFKQFLVASRQKLLQIINSYVPGKKEAGLAAALLIGYKNDLDKSLVNAYTNTGVVHIIAISGLHLGLIYFMLQFFLAPLNKLKKIALLRPWLILAGLWLFTLLAGAAPSITRAALMFSCIVLGEIFQRRAGVYNALAASAFILLCINPYWIWDIGFQLSYAAVLSIAAFMKPVYNLIFFQNKFLDAFWKLNAVTLSAQILTLPIAVYHFHQFPLYFLFTNMLAVPLSSLVLLGEILLCLLAFVPGIANWLGAMVFRLIQWMNGFIEYMDKMPAAVLDSLQINVLQLLLMYGTIGTVSFWLFYKNKTAIIIGCCCILCFSGLRFISFYKAMNRHKIIIYNLPGQQAVDFICGRKYYFKTDSDPEAPLHLQNLPLSPSRRLYRVTPVDSLKHLTMGNGCYIFHQKRIILLNGPLGFPQNHQRIQADLLILGKKHPLSMTDIYNSFDCPQWVFDGSNPAWKINAWMAECQKLGQNCYSVVDKPAFEMNMD